MNREIKYRAIHTLTKHWFDEEQLVFSNGQWFEDHRAFEDGRPLNMEHCEIMQYTGLYDKNGVEIYEGDVVEYYDSSFKRNVISSVHWSSPMFTVESGLLYFISKGTDKVFDGEVIGNIHEHQHLLERD